MAPEGRAIQETLFDQLKSTLGFTAPPPPPAPPALAIPPPPPAPPLITQLKTTLGFTAPPPPPPPSVIAPPPFKTPYQKKKDRLVAKWLLVTLHNRNVKDITEIMLDKNLIAFMSDDDELYHPSFYDFNLEQLNGSAPIYVNMDGADKKRNKLVQELVGQLNDEFPADLAAIRNYLGDQNFLQVGQTTRFANSDIAKVMYANEDVVGKDVLIQILAILLGIIQYDFYKLTASLHSIQKTN
jgi:hypothetical protein